MIKEEIDLGGITSISLSQGIHKSVMALLFKFFLKYDLAVVIDGIGATGMDGLLEWVKPRVAAEKPGLNDFTHDWTDGIAFLQLYNYTFKNEIVFDESVYNADNEVNLQRAFDLFEQKLGVPQLLKPEDVTGKAETKKGNVTYIVQIRNAIIKYEEEQKEQGRLNDLKAQDDDAKRKAENNEHDNEGDKLYSKGLQEMNGANSAAEEKMSEILMTFSIEQFSNMIPEDEPARVPTNAEYDVVVEKCLEYFEETLKDFDGASEKFTGAKEEYNKVVPCPPY
jgi:hypothetical protein